MFETELRAVAVAAIVGAMATLISPTGVAADELTVSNPRVVAHFDLSAGQTPEDMAVEPDGSADISFSEAAEVARVSLDGQVQVLGQLPRTGSCSPSPTALSL